MSSSKITLIGMQSYMKQFDKDLFELLTLPESIDKETVTDNILLKGSEFEVIYSNPEFLHDAIGIFSNKWQRTFNKWVEALNIDYNPLENYDRIEEWTDSGTSKDIEAGTSKDIEAGTNSKNQTVNTTNNGGSTVTDGTTTNSINQVSAYNTTEFQNDSKVTGSTTGTSNTSNNFTGNETLTDNTSNNNTIDRSNNNTIDRSNNNIHTGRTHGNIGVTTSMQLLESQLSIVEWNVIEHITDLFLHEFCIMVY